MMPAKLQFLCLCLIVGFSSGVSANNDEKPAEPAPEADSAKPSVPTKQGAAKQEPEKARSLDEFELPTVTVVGTTPLGATGLESKKVPGNVLFAEDEEIHEHEAFGLPDFMNRRLESVNINEAQNNPYQPDITYRGFNASSILGTPIGVSVFQDGVRVNEPFGDTVFWDLIPQVAIANMEMMPGSNPLFGLNTLGGALSIRTKSGSSHPGFRAEAYGGSYARQNYQAEYGGAKDGFDWYIAGNIFKDNGWRPYSPTSVNQAFGKVGWENDKTDLDLSFTFADNNLQGVGPTPQGWISEDWRAIYTAPDVTRNTLYFVTLKGSHLITDKLQLAGNVYNRNTSSGNLNSNTNEDCELLISNSECQGEDGQLQPIASYAQATTRENGTGVNLQLTSDYKILQYENQFMLGGGYNYGNTNFSIADQDAVFTPSRYEIATSPLVTSVKVNGQNAYANFFATDTFSIFKWLHVNAAVNWIQAQVKTNDKMGTALNGNHDYSRANPSAGFTVNPLDALDLKTPLRDLTTYFNYNEGFRVPTAVELSCADPLAPCTLPNSFISDPPLDPVVAKTLEVGLRGRLNDSLKWNFALYQTRNYDDILFVNSPGSVINGYFRNVGLTQRQGLELGLSGVALGSLNWYLSYGLVNATYQTSADLGNAFGAQMVRPGDRIPSIPEDTVKFGAEYEILKNWFFGGDLQYASSQYARGDDANVYRPIPGYTIVNLNTRYVVTENIEVFAMGRNIFNQQYASFGQMGPNFFENNQPTQFWGPGAPATGYAGVRIHWN